MQSIIALIRRHPLKAVLLLALVLRLTVLLALPQVFAFERTGVIHGIKTHDTYATNLLETGIYGEERSVPDGILPPLYSLFLAALYAVFGRGSLQLVLAQALLDAASIALLYRIARRLWPDGQRVALLGCCFHALYPYLLFQSLTMVDTSLYITGMYLLLWVLVQLNDVTGRHARHYLGLWATGGLVLGLILMLRPNIVLLLPFGGLWLAIRHGWLGSGLRLLPVMLLAAALLLPWMQRGVRIYGEPVFIALHGGGNFLQGNNPCTVPYLRAGYDTQWIQLDSYSAELEERNLAIRDAALMQAGIRYLRENPARIPELLWTKFLTQWSVDIWPTHNPSASTSAGLADEDCEAGIVSILTIDADDPTRVYDESVTAHLFRMVHRYYFGGLLLLALAGLVLTRDRWRDVSLLWFVLTSMTLVYVIYHPNTRYRAPTDPLLFLFSASALLAAWRWWSARRRDA